MKLRDWRKIEDLNQAEAAGVIGVTHSAVSKWESGQIPRPDQMRAIFEATGGRVTPCSFFGIDCPCELARQARLEAVAS